MEAECEKWLQKGINIHLETRDNRKGYKAGAMKEGMKCSYVKDCDYVAIFDADHQPGSNFLEQTVPYLIHNPDVALVQSRWKFGRLHITETRKHIFFLFSCRYKFTCWEQL